MKRKFYTVILCLIFCTTFAQVRLEFKLSGSTACVTLYNDSDNYYAIPLDKKNFRPYESYCSNFFDFGGEYPRLALMLTIKANDDTPEEYIIGFHAIDEKLDSLMQKENMKRDFYDKEMIKWGTDHQIKDLALAKFNHYISNNLIYLEPRSQTAFEIKVDLYNVTNQKFVYYTYLLPRKEYYQFQLELCDYAYIEQYLTPAQTEKLKQYKLFKGKLQSNVITLSAERVSNMTKLIDSAK